MVENFRNQDRYESVGRNVDRKEGMSKVTGQAKYVDDLNFEGMIYGRTIRSEIPRGKIKAIHLEFDTEGFTIVDYRDIPGKNLIALIQDDQPCLVESEINHADEPILLLAHPEKEKLLEAKVRIETISEIPVLDPLQSGKIFKEILISKGDIEAGFGLADRIVEGEYRTGHQEHVYIEPNGMIAVPTPDGAITVYGSLQCPYYVHGALMVLLGVPETKVRVVQTETGGGFGGKEDYPSIIACHAALLALKSGRPTKIVYDRVEDMQATTRRHPAIVRHRTGVAADGTLLSMDVEVIMDGGAYCTLSPVVLSRGVIHATGPYRCDNVRIRGRVVHTNTPPNGAFRGFGAPQTLFASEVHLDRIAHTLGLDPIEIREKNAFRPGDVTATGQVLPEDTSALQVLREALKKSDYYNIRKKIGTQAKRGVGVALYWHGSGFTGAGEVKLASKATLELLPSGAKVRVASTEIGQGTRTMLAQIVAQTLGWSYDSIEVSPADTAVVPDSGPTVASRTCMIVGRLLQRCAEEMRFRIGNLTPKQYLEKHGPLEITKVYEKPPAIQWDDEHYRGDAYGTYGWGCNVVDLEWDAVTYEVKVKKVIAVFDIGKAIHPIFAAGQIEGGTAQAIGYALHEEVVMRNGRVANPQLTNYIIPTTMDTPPIEAVIVENSYRFGPFGAKGVGEMPMDGPAAAIVNALFAAGVDVREIPATPERIMEAVCYSR
ncbi:MAG: xanthine dehydrogenase family protein [Myxococcales bacterium]|nr:xanthine dehydrogenase family protein [Myxococcales bacterium]